MDPNPSPGTSGDEADPVALYMPHLARSIRLVQRYAFVHSDAPVAPSHLFLLGPLVTALKTSVRDLLRVAVRAALGSQDDFNAAAADILIEFTRRAPLAQVTPGAGSRLAAALASIDSANPDARALAAALAAALQDQEALRVSVRAAMTSAAEAEKRVAELSREVERLRRGAG